MFDPNDLDLSDPKVREFVNTIFGGSPCAEKGCTETKDLRPWPPDNPKAPKYCGAHRLKQATK